MKMKIVSLLFDEFMSTRVPLLLKFLQLIRKFIQRFLELKDDDKICGLICMFFFFKEKKA